MEVDGHGLSNALLPNGMPLNAITFNMAHEICRQDGMSRPCNWPLVYFGGIVHDMELRRDAIWRHIIQGGLTVVSGNGWHIKHHWAA